MGDSVLELEHTFKMPPPPKSQASHDRCGTGDYRSSQHFSEGGGGSASHAWVNGTGNKPTADAVA